MLLWFTVFQWLLIQFFIFDASQWYSLMFSGDTQWFTVVYGGTQWYVMFTGVHSGSQWLAVDAAANTMFLYVVQWWQRRLLIQWIDCGALCEPALLFSPIRCPDTHESLSLTKTSWNRLAVRSTSTCLIIALFDLSLLLFLSLYAMWSTFVSII